MLHLGSRRKPYPFSAYIAGVPVMFKTDQNGKELYGKKEIDLEGVAPSVWDYASASPYKATTYPFRGLELGMGEVTQEGRGRPQRYRSCINVDWSLGFGIKGHHFHDLTPTNLGPVRDFVEALDGGQLKLFVLQERYVNVVNADDSITLSKNLGAGKKARQGVRFKAAGGSPVDALYVAVDGDVLQQYDGAAWHAGPFAVRNIASRRDELYGADSGNTIRKVTADPLVGANWAAAITIGDASAVITWMAQVNDALFTFKEDGIFSLDVEDVGGTPTVLAPDLFPAQRDAANGVNAQMWPASNSLWVPFDGGLQRLFLNGTGKAELEPIPLGWSMDPDPDVRGVPVAFAGHSTWFGYVALYDAASGNSYLGKYGTWIASKDGSGQYTFVRAFHCAIKEWVGRQITAMKVWGRSGENERLWVGFADGRSAWCWLPKNSPDPTSDAVCEFNTDTGWARWPLHHAGFEAMSKLFRGFSAFGQRISGTDKVTQEWRTDVNGAYQTLADDFTYDGQRVEISGNAVGRVVDCRTKLVNASTSSTPIVEGMGLDEQVRPDETLEYEMVVDAHLTASRAGTIGWRNPEQVREAVIAAASSKGAVRCLLPDETEQELSFLDHAEALDGHNRRSGLSWDIPLKAVQFKSSITLGTYERWEAWTYEEWEALTYDEWERI